MILKILIQNPAKRIQDKIVDEHLKNLIKYHSEEIKQGKFK